MRGLMILTAVAGLIALDGSAALSLTPSISLYSDDNQVIADANTPLALRLSGDSMPGFKVSGSKITVTAPGQYYVSIAVQVGGSATGYIGVFARLNGMDVPDSTFIQYVSSPQYTSVLSSQGEVDLKANDVIQFMISGSVPGIGAIALQPPGVPTAPSLIVSIYRLP
jgi:hypothetical protein